METSSWPFLFEFDSYPLMTNILDVLSYDLILKIIHDYLSDDEDALYKCSIINRDFNRAASKFLYGRIVVSPPFKPVLDLKSRGTPLPPAFTSAATPRNGGFVKHLEISGFLSSRPPPLDPLPTIFADAIRLFSNLESVVLCPSTFHKDLFVNSLKTLKEIASLVDVAVNSSCMGETTAPLLVELGHLQRLTLYSPGRTILNLSPEWLERLSGSLVGLHLRDNCGSVTPGVLKSFLPLIRAAVRRFSLGLSYSLLDADVFSFLSELHKLEDLQLQYYLQLRSLPPSPKFPNLRRITIDYGPVDTKDHAARLCKWTRTLISAAPVERLRLVCNDEQSKRRPLLAFDGLALHLIHKHSTTLRLLDLKGAHLRSRTLHDLFRTCVHLEEFCISSGKTCLRIFREHVAALKRLRTATFLVHNVKRRTYGLEKGTVTEIFSHASPSFERLVVNGREWRALRTLNNSEDTCISVE